MDKKDLVRIKKANNRIWSLSCHSKGGRAMSVYPCVHSQAIRKLLRDNDKICTGKFLDELNRLLYKKITVYCRSLNREEKILDENSARIILANYYDLIR